MNDRDHARGMFVNALEELQSLAWMMDPGDSSRFISDRIIGFHAQQVVEKLLKTWYSWHSIQYRRTHNLMVLLDGLADGGHDVTAFYDFVALNPFAVEIRYDTTGLHQVPLDRTTCLARLQELRDIVQAMLDNA